MDQLINYTLSYLLYEFSSIILLCTGPNPPFDHIHAYIIIQLNIHAYIYLYEYTSEPGSHSMFCPDCIASLKI